MEWRGPIVSKCPRRGKAWCAGRKQSIRTLERPGVLAEHPYVVEEKDQLAVCVVLHAWWPDLISCCCEALNQIACVTRVCQSWVIEHIDSKSFMVFVVGGGSDGKS